MPAPAAALSLLLLMTHPTGQGQPGIHAAACRYLVNGVCSDSLPSAGNGGQGGNVIYNIIIQPSQGGAGGNGGDIRSGAGKGPVKESTPGLAAIAPPPSVASVPSTGRCTLSIAGEPVVDHKDCQFDKSDKHFAFTAESLNQKYTYTAKVSYNEDKTGQGTLSGGKSKAVRDLGRMSRDKACWINQDESVRLCAWRK